MVIWFSSDLARAASIAPFCTCTMRSRTVASSARSMSCTATSSALAARPARV
jgi:hypothetical protein